MQLITPSLFVIVLTMQSSPPSEQVFWGPPLGGSLKSWGSKCGVQTLPCSEGAGHWGHLPMSQPGLRGFVASQPFLRISVWVFLIRVMVGVARLVSVFDSEEVTPCIAIPSVGLWEQGTQELRVIALVETPTFSY